MKRRSMLLYALAAALIVAAFAAPPLVLHASFAHSMQTPTLLDASAYALTASENTVEKLACLNDPRATTVQLGIEDEPETVAQSLREELQKLYELGAITQEFFDSFYSATYYGTSADRICMIQPEQQLVFEVYSIHLWGPNMSAILDASSGKVLWLRNSASMIGMFLKEYGNGLGTKELEGWAKYYGLTLEQVSYTARDLDEIRHFEHPDARYPSTILKAGKLTDNGGASVTFGLSYEFGESMFETYIWGPCG